MLWDGLGANRCSGPKHIGEALGREVRRRSGSRGTCGLNPTAPRTLPCPRQTESCMLILPGQFPSGGLCPVLPKWIESLKSHRFLSSQVSFCGRKPREALSMPEHGKLRQQQASPTPAQGAAPRTHRTQPHTRTGRTHPHRAHTPALQPWHQGGLGLWPAARATCTGALDQL